VCCGTRSGPEGDFAKRDGSGNERVGTRRIEGRGLSPRCGLAWPDGHNETMSARSTGAWFCLAAAAAIKVRYDPIFVHENCARTFGRDGTKRETLS